MRWRARSIEANGPRGRRAKYRTLVEKYQALAPQHRRALQYLGPWSHCTGPAQRTPASMTALRETVERERQQAMGELASTAAHEMNNVLHAMALRLASLRGQDNRRELTGGVEALARMVAEAAGMVRRLQDRAGKSRCEAQFTATPDPGRVLTGLRVLVVDDDPDVLEAAGLALGHLGQRDGHDLQQCQCHDRDRRKSHGERSIHFDERHGLDTRHAIRDGIPRQFGKRSGHRDRDL